ncbi:MAG: tRNA pseudouridine(54/55) synthase Pus10 [Thermoplasmatales archaeon]|nr:tRNA pseudouridine(54/55) synthase Pus10 [Thermoplasmatales archaeon]
MKEIEKEVEKLSKYGLCDSCLGRQFAKLKDGMKNYERGIKIRSQFKIEEAPPKDCWLCSGISNEIEKYAELVMKEIKKYEFDSFLIGCKIDEEILRKEKEIATPYSESIKREIDRELGKIIEKNIQKRVDFESPDIVAIIDTSFDRVKIDVKPIFIYGRYKKLIRGIPQTKWYCRKCHGIGCKYCNYKGKMYDESVEELIAHEALKEFEANDESFHGAGREDIDVLMLGNGRPFILELNKPKKRRVELKMLEKKINEHANGKVIVSDLRYASREEIEKLKSAKYEKVYRVKIKFAGNGKINEAVNALRDRKIFQHTPSRVAHRRADKIRERKIIDIKIKEMKMDEAIIEVVAEAGTYIKELITGDNGRTTPSLAELYGSKIEVEELDVIYVGDENEKVERI